MKNLNRWFYAQSLYSIKSGYDNGNQRFRQENKYLDNITIA